MIQQNFILFLQILLQLPVYNGLLKKEGNNYKKNTIPVTLQRNSEERDETDIYRTYFLAKDSKGYAYASLKDTEDWIPLTNTVGDPIGDNTWEGWSVIGAETVNGVNTTV